MNQRFLSFALLTLASTLFVTSQTIAEETTSTQPAAESASEAAPQSTTGSYILDPTHASVGFAISHLGYSKITGRFNSLEGTIHWNEEHPEQSVIEVSAKAESVDTNNQQRDEHLKNADFFNVEAHKIVSFKSTSIKKIAENRYEITGDISLLGVTKPVTVEATLLGSGTDPWGGFRIGATSSFTVKRSDFGMSNSLNMIGDEVEVTVDIEAIKT